MIQEAQALQDVSTHGDIAFQVIHDKVKVEILGLADDDVEIVWTIRVRSAALLNVKIDSESQLGNFSQRPINAPVSQELRGYKGRACTSQA